LTAIAARPLITPVDRFGLTLCLAIIAHGIIILGVTFAPEDTLEPRYETMEIILVQQESEPPEQTTFLAQANLTGGGDSAEPENPTVPQPAPFPDERPEITAPPPIEVEPPEKTAPPPDPEIAKIAPEPQPLKDIEQLTVVARMAEKLPETIVETRRPELNPVEKTVARAGPVREGENKPAEDRVETPPLPSATALLTNSFKIASLSAEVRRKLEAKAERPRRKFISASTREYKYAAYMEAWRAKVERVGNLNYPDDARKNNLSGSLILDVALNADGSVNQITIRRTSGSQILDDAAIRIVELSSPFAPFPEHIRKETDILHITRTWQFLNDNRFK